MRSASDYSCRSPKPELYSLAAALAVVPGQSFSCRATMNQEGIGAFIIHLLGIRP